MGLLFILPIAGVSTWVIYSSIRALRRGEVSPAWRNRLIILLLTGMILGFYCAFLFQHQPTAERRVEGLPIPTTIHRLENETWKSEKVFPIIGGITNFIFGIAVALLPLKFAAMLNQVKPKDSGQL